MRPYCALAIRRLCALSVVSATIEPRRKPSKNERVPLLSGLQEVLYVKADGALRMHDWVEIPNPDYGRETIFGDSKRKALRTTVGRVIFNDIWPAGLGFVNFPVPKAKLGDLILNTYKIAGNHVTVETLDRLKELGFQTAFQAGISRFSSPIRSRNDSATPSPTVTTSFNNCEN